jgi:hypothetical protein
VPEIDAERAAGLRQSLQQLARQAAIDGDANALTAANKMLDDIDGVRRGPGYVSRTGPSRIEYTSTPDKSSGGLLREVTKTDAAGRRITEFVGAVIGRDLTGKEERAGPLAWMAQFMHPKRMCALTNVRSAEQQGRFATWQVDAQGRRWSDPR